MKVSFVIPCYRSSHTISGVVDEIQETMEKSERKDYEIILVNDSSPDDTFDAIQKLCASKNNITVLCHLKNHKKYSLSNKGVKKIIKTMETIKWEINGCLQ